MRDVGNTLREARIRKGLTITDVESVTKIRTKYLQALEENDFEVRSYSGRAMYGETCLGVDIPYGVGDLMATLILAVDEDDRDDVAEAVETLRMDSMGLGQIVYFPRVPFVEKEHECEECGVVGDECECSEHEEEVQA